MENICKICGESHKTGACVEFDKQREQTMSEAVKNARGFRKKTKEENAMNDLHRKALYEDKMRDEAKKITKVYGVKHVYNPPFGIEKLSDKEKREQIAKKKRIEEIDREFKRKYGSDRDAEDFRSLGAWPGDLASKKKLFSQMKQEDFNNYMIVIEQISEMAFGGSAHGLKSDVYPDWEEDDFWDLLVLLGEEEELKRVLEAKEAKKFTRRI